MYNFCWKEADHGLARSNRSVKTSTSRVVISIRRYLVFYVLYVLVVIRIAVAGWIWRRPQAGSLQPREFEHTQHGNIGGFWSCSGQVGAVDWGVHSARFPRRGLCHNLVLSDFVRRRNVGLCFFLRCMFTVGVAGAPAKNGILRVRAPKIGHLIVVCVEQKRFLRHSKYKLYCL